MTHKGLKFTVAGVVFAAAVLYLGISGAKVGSAFTMPVDQFVASVDQQKVRVRLCGVVSEKDMKMNKGQLWARFTLKGEKTEVKVAYKGVVPDMFKGGSEVVVEGKRNEAGVFAADVLLTKCASKYEERPAGHPGVETQNAKYETSNVGGRP